MNKIKYYRNKNYLTLKKLSSLTNLSIGYLCHLEKGTRNNPSYKVMRLISTALGKEIADIF